MPSDSSSRRLTCEALGRAERVNHRIGNAANAANIERNRPICIALNRPAKTLAQGNVSANAATAGRMEGNRPICIALNWPAKTLAQGNVSANAATDIRPKRYACISTEAVDRESAWFMVFRLW